MWIFKDLQADFSSLSVAVMGVCMSVHTYVSTVELTLDVCTHIYVYLFLKDMDTGSWLPADGVIQVEYKHRTLLKSSVCSCLDYAALSLR